ncbi:cytochrome c oxidase assembly factor Coa1 family protein [Tahibacter amnicola]|uniref:Cytochrome c oxidase assembly factor Coa1 family protein n=1 Tax=Tahibacter amnicola TaxID=2976241 RepID=A0ABY6BCI4_9GAMM|nr:cytochrome c oxidase assembly factor Coa1 family protein [Tahibacter amnicola]UXI67434.1 cytochrome c oxidase assembly factor Coa1 family protein [Tahibacter amnicola]
MTTASAKSSVNRRVVVAIIVGGLVLMAAMVAGILAIVAGAMKASDAYTTSVAKALNDPVVIQALGPPVKAGWLPTGQIRTGSGGGFARLSISLEGRKEKATLTVHGTKSEGQWRYSVMRVTIAGTGQEIDLLEGR